MLVKRVPTGGRFCPKLGEDRNAAIVFSILNKNWFFQLILTIYLGQIPIMCPTQWLQCIFGAKFGSKVKIGALREFVVPTHFIKSKRAGETDYPAPVPVVIMVTFLFFLRCNRSPKRFEEAL